MVSNIVNKTHIHVVLVNVTGDITRGNWSTAGCMLKEMNPTTKVYMCECNHLTNFAVLVVSKTARLCFKALKICV